MYISYIFQGASKWLLSLLAFSPVVARGAGLWFPALALMGLFGLSGFPVVGKG